MSFKKRIIHDAIHGSFYLPNDIWRIIDTPEFQRLREIKQTGNAYLVYMCANHTRFEHSIGVAHLCGQYGNKILTYLNKQSFLNKTINTDFNEQYKIFTDRDVFLLQVAGLCHDLGHACFSHLFDNVILPALNPGKDLNFKHETASFLILERINQRLNILTEDELNLIGKIIYGSEDKIHPSLKDRLKWTKNDQIRTFMFQILSNEENSNNHHCSHLCNETDLQCNSYGVDVDKFDYIKRDGLYTGIQTTFDIYRLIELINLSIQDHRILLSYDQKAHELIRSMWVDRNDLYRRVYQHKTVKCIDAMYTKAFIASAPYLNFKSDDNDKMYNIAEIYQDMSAYCKLTDHVIHQINQIDTDLKGINPDTGLIKRIINHRRLWKVIKIIKTDQELPIINSDLITVNQLPILIKRIDTHQYLYYIYNTKS